MSWTVFASGGNTKSRGHWKWSFWKQTRIAAPDACRNRSGIFCLEFSTGPEGKARKHRVGVGDAPDTDGKTVGDAILGVVGQVLVQNLQVVLELCSATLQDSNKVHSHTTGQGTSLPGIPGRGLLTFGVFFLSSSPMISLGTVVHGLLGGGVVPPQSSTPHCILHPGLRFFNSRPKDPLHTQQAANKKSAHVGPNVHHLIRRNPPMSLRF